ncbi:MAG: redoxin domain-containing protein [Myxococcota bacterium]|nr:redoxin domain-containing protein [Myxococcota bacterium]
MGRDQRHQTGRLGFGAVLVAALVACTGCGGGSGATHANEAQQGSVIGEAVPDLELAPLNGGTAVRLSDLRGKVVLLDVWASWCAPCKEELPMLDEMVGRLRKKGVEIVAVSIDDNRQDAEAFLQSRPGWSLRFAHDPEGQVPGKLQPPKMPSSYVIDRKGIIREMNAGFARSDAPHIEARLSELAERTPDEPGATESPAPVASAAVAPEPTAAAPESPSAAPSSAPTAAGSIDGKPFAPKTARIASRMQKDGRVLLNLTERTDCGRPGDAKPGDGNLAILLPWKDGYRGELASLKRGAKSPAVTFSRVNGAKKNEVSKTFKPIGKVAIVSAPMQQNGVGKMSLDLTNGDYHLTGDFDVKVCVSPK